MFPVQHSCTSVNNMGKTQRIGNIGENIAATFLESKGYRILTRNYNKKWGEIDIVAQMGNITHFVEVKTISRESKSSVSREKDAEYRPEENMHRKKIERLQRAMQSYLGEFNIEGEWQLDLVAVKIFLKDKTAECKILLNVL